MMKKTLILTLLFLVPGLLAFADGYWLECKGSGLPGDTLSIRIRYGGEQGRRYRAGNFIPRKKGIYRIFAIDESLPILERPDSSKNVKPVQYLCSAYSVKGGGSYDGAIQSLDLQVEVKNKLIRVVPFIGKKPVSQGTPLRVFYPDNHDEKIEVDKSGVATLSVVGKGLYLIRLDLMDGRVRHRCDYSLEINDD